MSFWTFRTKNTGSFIAYSWLFYYNELDSGGWYIPLLPHLIFLEALYKKMALLNVWIFTLWMNIGWILIRSLFVYNVEKKTREHNNYRLERAK